MGSKAAKTILPLVAIAGIGMATGGFGLMGAGAAGGAAGGAGAAGAAGAGAGAAGAAGGVGSAMAASSVPVGAMSTLSSAGFPMSTTAAMQASSAAALPGLGAGAGAATGAASGAAAATPWWQSAWQWAGANKDIIGLGMSGVSSVVSGIGAHNQAVAQENMLKLQAAQDSLALAERERDSQLKLSQVLATQNNMFAARGVDPSSGSAMQAQEAAQNQAERELSLYGVYSDLQRNSYSQRRRMAARAKAGAPVGALLNFGSTAYDVWRG